MNKEDFCDLFHLAVCGALAQAFLHRGITPTEEEFEKLKEDGFLTSRNIGEMLFHLDCQGSLSITLMNREVTE